MKIGFLYPEIGGIYDGLQELGIQMTKEHGTECIITNSLDEIRAYALAGVLSHVVIVFGGLNITAQKAQKVLQKEFPFLKVIVIEAPHWNAKSDTPVLAIFKQVLNS